MHTYIVDNVLFVLIIIIFVLLIIRYTCQNNYMTMSEFNVMQRDYLSYLYRDSKKLNTNALITPPK